ncbi:hypothetical protein NQ317_003928 [Molorchus minor]|uniref:C3H1-type domain-containing protein n=1 Tax=Molorchus minor TaxID=1323400 RepID=A0ABQ9IVI2_9CUCU|nr:hypothetical protein NQ317_003928 [Molorchus minor]
MSDTSEETVQSDRANDKDESICRDFIRGLCDRKFCKYKHENEARTLNFCHDYQNNVCPRGHCKFIHCTPEEVEDYKRTGEMSNQILAEATKKISYQAHRLFAISLERVFVEGLFFISLGTVNGLLRRNGVNFEEYQNSGLPSIKRRFLTTQEQEILVEPDRSRPVFKGYFAGNPPSPILSRVDARTLMLEEENSMLHKEIAQLKRQVSDLTATNEFLLDQNATLRMTGKQNGGINVPSVGLTNTNPQQQPQQVSRTVIASVATVPVSLATVSTCNPVSGNHSVSIAGCPSVSIAPAAQLLAPSQQILVTTNPSPQLTIANSSQAQLAIAQQNLANNLAQQAQPQLTSQAQQLALATTTQQLTSQAQHIANQQLALANGPQQLTSQPQQLTLANNPQNHQLNQQLTSQAQQLANQQLNSQAQQLANQQLTSQAQQLALATTTQQLTSQAQQLALANTTQQLTSQAQQLAMANTPQQLAVANVPQQLALASTNQQLLAQQSLASSQIEIHRNNQIAINTSQAIAMSNASQPMVSYPIMTQSINHALTH